MMIKREKNLYQCRVDIFFIVFYYYRYFFYFIFFNSFFRIQGVHCSSLYWHHCGQKFGYYWSIFIVGPKWIYIYKGKSFFLVLNILIRLSYKWISVSYFIEANQIEKILNHLKTSWRKHGSVCFKMIWFTLLNLNSFIFRKLNPINTTQNCMSHTREAHLGKPISLWMSIQG